MKQEEFNKRVTDSLRATRNEYAQISARLSLSALSLIKDRIINEGKDHTGKSFSKYSQNKLPFFFFSNAISQGAQDKLEKAKKKAKGISYEEWRNMNNLQTKNVDFKFTGDTWKDIGVVESRVSGDTILTVVTSKDSISKRTYNAKKQVIGSITTGKVTEHLANRYGDFLTLSDSEQQAINEAFDEEIQNIVDKIFA